MTTDRLIPTIRSVRDNAIDNALAGDTITRQNALVEEHDAIKAGVNPARDIAYPTKTADGKKVSLSARSAAEAEATPEDIIPTINRMVANGINIILIIKPTVEICRLDIIFLFLKADLDTQDGFRKPLCSPRKVYNSFRLKQSKAASKKQGIRLMTVNFCIRLLHLQIYSLL